jgi:hypothetical protein
MEDPSSMSVTMQAFITGLVVMWFYIEGTKHK